VNVGRSGRQPLLDSGALVGGWLAAPRGLVAVMITLGAGAPRLIAIGRVETGRVVRLANE
jgi:hypothetical protein